MLSLLSLLCSLLLSLLSLFNIVYTSRFAHTSPSDAALARTPAARAVERERGRPVDSVVDDLIPDRDEDPGVQRRLRVA